MRAERCDRYGFELDGRRVNYSALRHYACAVCGGAVQHVAVWDEGQDKSVDRVACAACGSVEFVSEASYARRRSKSMEAKYSLPHKVRKFYEQNREKNMPLKDIAGLGDLTKLGNIRLGWTEPGQSGRDRPVASDYFVLNDAPFLAQVLGEKPSELLIHFPYPNFDDNIGADYRVWAGSSRKGSGIAVCQGDGEIVHSALPFKVSVGGDGKTRVNRAPGDRTVSYGKAAIDFQWGERTFKEGEVVPCPGSSKGLYPHCEVCEPSILVKVMIREPIEAARWGYWQIATRSLRNYRHFMAVWASITNGGKIPVPMNDVPFVLRIMPGSTLYQNQSDKTWASREAFFLKLEVDQEVAELVEGARKRRFAAMLEGRVDPMLAPQLSARLERDFQPEDEPPTWSDAEYDEIDHQADLVEARREFEGAAMDEGAYEDLKEDEAEPVELVPAPVGLDHRNIVQFAVEMLGYENAGQVKSALLALVGPTWNRSTEWSPSAEWVRLQEGGEDAV